MDLDEECHLKNVFWADARSRATYETFEYVGTFEPTYHNEYDMPFAHHRVQSSWHTILLDYGCYPVRILILLLGCLSHDYRACRDIAIIIYQCKSIQRAVEKMFPKDRNQCCL